MSVYTGCNLYTTSPFNFIRRPILWIQSLDKFKITHSCGPNFSYELCIKQNMSTYLEKIDLSSVKVLINGAKPIRLSTLENFCSTFSFCNLSPQAVIPAYGLAEASLIVAANIEQDLLTLSINQNSFKTNHLKLNDETATSISLVSSGRVIENLDVLIMNTEEGKICDDLEVGEILIAGASVTEGYMDANSLNHDLFCSIEGRRYPSYLKTDDLGFMYNNHLFVTGRKKDLIIHYGKNIYPQDIERIAEESCTAIRKSCCAAFGIENDSQIILVTELKTGTDPKSYPILAEQIRTSVSKILEVTIDQVVFIASKSISKTTSGKIQRQLIKKKFNEQQLETLHV